MKSEVKINLPPPFYEKEWGRTLQNLWSGKLYFLKVQLSAPEAEN